MATKAGPSFRLGSKQVFLPNHVITLIRPKAALPPTFATFRVPLRFNKFDLRDYLHNVYSVSVTAVRSSIRAAPPKRRTAGDDYSNGIVHRPQPRKYMTVELERPFVYPPLPAPGAAREPFDTSVWRRMQAETERDRGRRADQLEGEIAMRTRSSDAEAEGFRRDLRRRAARLLSGHDKWDNGVELDERWTARPAHGQRGLV